MTKPILIFSLLDTPAFGGAEQYVYSHLKSVYTKRNTAIYLATNNNQVFSELERRISTLQSKRNNRKIGKIPLPFFLEKAPYRLDAIGNWKGLIKFFITLPWALFWLTGKLIRLRQEYRVVCYLPGFTDRLVFTPIIKLLGLPLIWIDIAPLEPLFPRLSGFPRLLYLLVRHMPDHIVCTSLWTLESICRVAGVPKEKMTLIYPGVTAWNKDEVQLFKKQGLREQIKRGFSNSFTIGFVGRLVHENEVDLVIKAFAKVRKEAKSAQNLYLLIIGEGPSKSAYEALTKQLKISKYVHFTGFITEETKHALLSICNVFTFTRAWDLDGFGMTTIEAMALGVPVITSYFGPQKEIIDDKVSGLFFKPHDWQSLAQKIQWYLDNPSQRKKIAAAGQKRALFFDHQIQLPLVHKVIEDYRT